MQPRYFPPVFPFLSVMLFGYVTTAMATSQLANHRPLLRSFSEADWFSEANCSEGGACR